MIIFRTFQLFQRKVQITPFSGKARRKGIILSPGSYNDDAHDLALHKGQLNISIERKNRSMTFQFCTQSIFR
jgi:hypothetical protein